VSYINNTSHISSQYKQANARESRPRPRPHPHPCAEMVHPILSFSALSIPPNRWLRQSRLFMSKVIIIISTSCTSSSKGQRRSCLILYCLELRIWWLSCTSCCAPMTTTDRGSHRSQTQRTTK